jgi:hypothetical protein
MARREVVTQRTRPRRRNVRQRHEEAARLLLYLGRLVARTYRLSDTAGVLGSASDLAAASAYDEVLP